MTLGVAGTTTPSLHTPGSVSRVAAHHVPRRWRRELGLFLLAYLTYFGVRAVTEGSSAVAFENARALIRLEQQLGIFWEARIQEVVLESRLLAEFANAVYIYGHWPVIIAAGVLLYRYRRPDYVRLRNAFLVTGAVGLVIFALFPVAPPRLTDLPLIDTVTKGAEGYRLVVPRSLVNQYAAMPSFHAGWNLLVGIVVFGATRHLLLRALSVLGPASMMLATVATANHFVIDVVVGSAIVLAGLALVTRLERRRMYPGPVVGRPREGHEVDAASGGS
jgi:hypothetical protein